MATPESVKEHSHNSDKHTWRMYDLWELGMWVHLLTKRGFHRSDEVKQARDFTDAQNYLNMLQQRLNEASEGIVIRKGGKAQKVESNQTPKDDRQLPAIVSEVLRAAMPVNVPLPMEVVSDGLRQRVSQDRVGECSDVKIMEIMKRSGDFETEKRDHNRVWVTRKR